MTEHHHNLQSFLQPALVSRLLATSSSQCLLLSESLPFLGYQPLGRHLSVGSPLNLASCHVETGSEGLTFVREEEIPFHHVSYERLRRCKEGPYFNRW